METANKQFKKRNAIMNCLMQTKAHPSAEMVLEMLRDEQPDISMATVYRNLAWFKERGMIVSVANVNGIERFDANTKPHVHFICNCCNAVIDLDEIKIPQQLNRAAERSSGCRVDDCRLTFTGQCGNCRSISNPK